MPYFPYNRYPYSNFHDLNLDWILETIQDLYRRIISYEGSATPYESDPRMDGIADPGNVNQFARGDHRHPTDTTRASVEALQTVRDSVPGPSNGLPRMDGDAYSGFFDNYSRADHVHPSDTSKLDKAGGQMSGIIDMVPRRAEATIAAAGWYRAIEYDAYDAASAKGSSGEIVDISIIESSSVSAQHFIRLFLASNNINFIDEQSNGASNLIDKVRYCTSGNKGYLDLHFTASSAVAVNVSFNVASRIYAATKWKALTLSSIADSPNDTTIEKEYTFMPHTDASTSFNAFGKIWHFTKKDGIVYIDAPDSMTPTTNGANAIGTLPAEFRPRYTVRFCAANAEGTYKVLAITENGTVQAFCYTTPNEATPYSITASYIV